VSRALALAVLAGVMAAARPAVAQAPSAQAPPVQMHSPSEGSAITGLPVLEVPAPGASGPLMAVILSGDGGWAAADKEMAAALAQRGIPVVGFDTPSYLTTSRTPDGAASDLQRLVQHYLGGWHKRQVLLIGYSHGADLAPFMVSRLDADLRDRIALLALLGLEHQASFRFHLADLIAEVSRPGDLPVLPEVEKLRGMPLLCVEGADERHSLCASLDPSLARVETHAGGHRISGSAGKEVVDLILSAARSGEPH
jgi:type IV secretory pathway VirJ component